MEDQATLTATFDRLAHDAIAALPPPYRAAASHVALRIEDWPPRDMLRAMGIDDPLDLTGLYEGIPLIEKSVFDQPLGPDTIWLFREPILAEWRDRGDVALADLVAHVYVHELAHHFGWSDEDIATIDQWWM
ncbi:metallopeptidase family protein [Primorskyibacter aestuariivivens]|uniref:metallopeptidase family protein n=1 Tax=Primorskyibacter aestuariivivens TaxID=1888912 RepID=UPI0023014111|nr:metallopeptidase family protein [Primorskyibacter aestuariivivens]MDA7428143.1 metallopeptidase family protein [Primorskyibacter aestuariivivens]